MINPRHEAGFGEDEIIAYVDIGNERVGLSKSAGKKSDDINSHFLSSDEACEHHVAIHVSEETYFPSNIAKAEITFGEAAAHDKAKYGRSGRYWKHAYDLPTEGDHIPDIDLGTYKATVIMSGDFTFDIAYEAPPEFTFGEAASHDKAEYGSSGAYWRHAYNFPTEGDYIPDLNLGIHKAMVIGSGDFTFDIAYEPPSDFSLEEAQCHDTAHYGHSGQYWKRDYNYPTDGDVIFSQSGLPIGHVFNCACFTCDILFID